jgi:DNA repair protein RecN (Recombination protein N)
MLSRLTIENYALIDRLEIEFRPGFSVITGETGAGKSILVGAISLILGQRSDGSVLLDKSRKCIVEGFFHTKDYKLDDFFAVNLLDQDDYTILRREINQAGKSRAFINDTPVSLTVLKDLGDRLVNIHSQHSIVTLHDSDFQLAVIDSFAGNRKILEKYRDGYSLYLTAVAELDDLKQKESRLRRERDYYQFLHHELEEANLAEGEQETSEARMEILSHSEEIKTQLQKITLLLSEGEGSTLNLLSDIISSLQHIADYHASYGELGNRVNSDFIDLKDISREVVQMEDEVQYDPEEITRISARLDQIYALEKKHNVTTLRDLIRVREEIAERLQEAGTMDERMAALEKNLSAQKDALMGQATKISDRRKGVCRDMEKRISETLVKLGIPDARISLELTSGTELTNDGIDEVRFLFSANKGIGMADVSKIASGGEQSRLMLGIKSLISEKNLLPTIIFDEIDNGVSGNVAGKVASMLKAMGKTLQVVAITHLPQIAGQGDTHYWVYKTSGKGTTRTHIKILDKEERVNEIAKMLSNENITASSVKAARELMKDRVNEI